MPSFLGYVLGRVSPHAAVASTVLLFWPMARYIDPTAVMAVIAVMAVMTVMAVLVPAAVMALLVPAAVTTVLAKLPI